MAPLTGVPLPFISYGSSNLIVLLGAMGLLLNVAPRRRGRPRRAAGNRELRAIDGGASRARGDGPTAARHADRERRWPRS